MVDVLGKQKYLSKIFYHSGIPIICNIQFQKLEDRPAHFIYTVYEDLAG